jgi:N-acetylmuramoyl-L-alanine amidase
MARGFLMFKRNILELCMAVLLLFGLFILSREGAELVANQTGGKKTVVIDAGHGAVDPGKEGVNGLLEKDINLTLALKLEKDLKKKGLDVVMTRRDDEPLYSAGARNRKAEDMQKRVALINQTKPDCVISIHQNSYTQESVQGAQVFYYQSSIEGKRLGEIMQKNLVDGLDPENDRLAKANGTYFLLKKTEAPLAIVECGFLSNYEEAELLGDKKYQTKMIKAISSGIMEYLAGPQDNK